MRIALLDSLILDRTAKRSLQRQLGLELKRLIQRGALPAGGPVPSSRALAEDLRVSRNTVTGAYHRLVSEGYLDARPRSGLFVSASLASVPRVRNQRPAIRPPLDPDDTAPALPEPRPFRPCQPDVRLFPLTVWNRLRARRLRVDSAAPLHYQSGLAMGLKELRQALAAYLRDSRGVECDWRQVAITSGSQQALYILGQLLLDAGDRVYGPTQSYFDRSWVLPDVEAMK